MNKYALICEDDFTTASCIKSMLKQLGYQTDIALTAKETLELLENKEYDLMTLDIILPDKNGIDLLKEIKNNEKTKDLPIIVISAAEHECSEIDNQIIYWLEKSFDFKMFGETVKKIVKNKNSNKLKILHLEDDEDVLNVTALTLNDIAVVTKANSLKKAKEVIKEDVFDIIILDYKLNDGTCDEIIDDIKSTPNKDSKLILFSAYEPKESLSKSVEKVILKSYVSSTEFIAHIKALSDKP